jgi:hypothetical protein
VRRQQEMLAMSLTARQQSLIPPAEDLTGLQPSSSTSATTAAGGGGGGGGSASQPWQQAKLMRHPYSWHRQHHHTLGSVEEDEGIPPQHMQQQEHVSDAAAPHIIISVPSADGCWTPSARSVTQSEIVPATSTDCSSSGGIIRRHAVPSAQPTKRNAGTAAELCTPLLLLDAQPEPVVAAADVQSQQLEPGQQDQPPTASEVGGDLSHVGSRLLLQRYFSSSYQQEQQQQTIPSPPAPGAACSAAALAPLDTAAAPAASELFGEVSDLPSDDSGGRDSCSSMGAPSSISHWLATYSITDSRPSSFTATPPAANVPNVPFPACLHSKAREQCEPAADRCLLADQGRRASDA